MGKWFSDFSFWTRDYRTGQCTYCALKKLKVLVFAPDLAFRLLEVSTGVTTKQLGFARFLPLNHHRSKKMTGFPEIGNAD